MSIEYDDKAEDAAELRRRARDLLDGRYCSSSDRNNAEMTMNILGHTMSQLADALDRIEALEARLPPDQ